MSRLTMETRLRIFNATKETIYHYFSPALSCKNRSLYRRNGERFTHMASGIMTMKEVNSTLHKWMGTRIGWYPQSRDRTHLLKFLPKSQEELPPRSIKDSFAEAIIPLSSEPRLQNRYVTAIGKLRMGRVIEDMDFFSVFVALKYIKNPLQKEDSPTPYTIVTAAVDDIEYIFEKPDVTSDVKLSGKVVSVGKSSLSIIVTLSYKMNDKWSQMTKANFLMAARNSTLTEPAFVNRLEPSSPEEEMEIKDALGNQARQSKR
nr:acyl-coenzyme A thioesterase 9, mitochondrial-like [Halyomorpha halys]